MPWQRAWVDVVYEIDPETGLLAYREDRCTVPRQSGKTTIFLPRVLHRALFSGNADLPFGASPQNIRYGAQTGSDARKKWQDDWLPVLRKTRFRHFYRERLTNGHEALIFANGSMQSLLANTGSSGHGGTVDLGLLDEVFAYKDARMEQALLPAMITRPQPQFGMVSTAGTPTDSPYLYGKVLDGRDLAQRQADDESLRRGTAYLEFSAPDDADPYDPATWWACMPALGYTVTEAAVRAALDTMLADPKLGLNEFRRAYLNQWVLAMGDPIVPLDAWAALANADASRPPFVVLGVDVGPKDSAASIVAVGPMAYGLQSTVLDNGPGTGWLPQRLHDLVEKYAKAQGERPWVIVDGKHCAHLIPEFERVAGFERVRPLGPSEASAACAFWLRMVGKRQVWHRGEPELTSALAGAGQRKLSDGWAWSREKSGTDITPLVALTNAVSFFMGSYEDEEVSG